MESNLQIIQQAFENFSRGNVQAIADACTDDVVWGSYDNPRVPYAGMYKGKEGVMKFFSTLGANVNYTSFTPREFYAQGETVIVLGRHAGTVRKTGKTFDHEWAMFFKFRGQKVYSYFAFVDSQDQSNAFA